MSIHFPSSLKIAPVLRILACCIAPLFSVSCALMKPTPPKKAEIVMYEWEDDGEGGPLKIRINLKEQKAAYLRGNRQVGWSLVSTGREGHSTPTGEFKVTEKMPLKVSNRYGWIADSEGKVAIPSAKPSTPVPPGHEYRGAEMHHWMRLTSYGIGLHAGEIAKPGTPLSHGCIRLPKDFVAKLYEVTLVGTPVQIVHGG
jgi:hypothetical protein